jgi:RNA polymerase sigma factor (sigma-70 family)
LNDRELVEKLLAKDEEAYRLFYQSYRERLYKVCAYILGYQDPDAEDVTQEVFLVALQRLPQFQFRSTLYHWLHCICTYLCYERIRKRKRQVLSASEDLEAVAGPQAMAREEKELQDEKTRKLLELMESQKQLLGDPCRSLLDLREKEKKSYAQLAEIFKVPIGTINSRMARCLEALKNLFVRALKEKSLG